MPQNGRSCNVELVIACPHHDQVKKDVYLVTEQSSRLVSDFLEEHQCPAGNYRVSLLKAIHMRKPPEKRLSAFQLNVKRNTIKALIGFGGTGDYRKVELIMPEGVKAELVHHLLVGKIAEVVYHRETKYKIDIILKMMLWALHRALISGSFSILIGEVVRNDKGLTDGMIALTGYSGHNLTFVIKPEGKPTQEVVLYCRGEANHYWISLMMLVRAGVEDCVGEPRKDVEALKAQQREVKEKEGRKLRTCRYACYKMLADDSFPEVPEKSGKQYLAEACRKYDSKQSWGTFRVEYLDPIGKNCYVPKPEFFTWLADNLQESPAIVDRLVEVSVKVAETAERLRQEDAERMLEAAGQVVEMTALAERIITLQRELAESQARLKLLMDKGAKPVRGETSEYPLLTSYQALMEGPFGQLTEKLEKGKKKHQRSE